jgi:hypothetical protein
MMTAAPHGIEIEKFSFKKSKKLLQRNMRFLMQKHTDIAEPAE